MPSLANRMAHELPARWLASHGDAATLHMWFIDCPMYRRAHRATGSGCSEVHQVDGIGNLIDSLSASVQSLRLSANRTMLASTVLPARLRVLLVCT